MEMIGQNAPLVSYLRVDARDDHLGIEPQLAAIADFVELFGFEIVAEFVEVGANSEAERLDLRPVLAKALGQARDLKCPLAVAELDRLGRNHTFIAELAAPPVQIIIIGREPSASPLMLSAYALSGIQKDQFGRRRRKQAINNLRDVGQQIRAIHKKTEADRFALEMLPLIEPLRAQGMSFMKIAAALNRRGVPTTRGRAWAPGQIRAILKRIAQIEYDRRDGKCPADFASQ
jgi:hypothetical protein